VNSADGGPWLLVKRDASAIIYGPCPPVKGTTTDDISLGKALAREYAVSMVEKNALRLIKYWHGKISGVGRGGGTGSWQESMI